jgi:hypothetical protein
MLPAGPLSALLPILQVRRMYLIVWIQLMMKNHAASHLLQATCTAGCQLALLPAAAAVTAAWRPLAAWQTDEEALEARDDSSVTVPEHDSCDRVCLSHLLLLLLQQAVLQRAVSAVRGLGEGGLQERDTARQDSSSIRPGRPLAQPDLSCIAVLQ